MSFDNYEFVGVDEMEKDTFKKVGKTKNLILQTTNESLFAFVYNDNGNHIAVPLPDFTLVYFDFAYNLNRSRKEKQKEMLSKLRDFKKFSEVSGETLYSFYGHSSSCIINLFTSIECFINHLIPEDKNYVDKKSNRTELYDKKQIQEQLAFWDKLKKVLPQFYDNKNFFAKSTPTNEHIVKLKELRDLIIHTKSDMTGELQIELFKKLLKFNYDETFKSVMKFMNFYIQDYIEECPCNNDF